MKNNNSMLDSDQAKSCSSAGNISNDRSKVNTTTATERGLGKPPLAHKESMNSESNVMSLVARTQKSFRIHRTGKRVSGNQLQ